MGPVQNEMQFMKLKGLIADCRERGYVFALDEPDGGRDDLVRQSLDAGFFLWPMIVDDPPAESALVMEEQFGESNAIRPDIVAYLGEQCS